MLVRGHYVAKSLAEVRVRRLWGLEENVAAAKLKLTSEEWKAIDAIAG